MSTDKLVREIARWVRDHNFCNNVEIVRTGSKFVVQFICRTTTTRASSMVTRLRLLVGEIAGQRPTHIGKVLGSALPKTRADLATWMIFVEVPMVASHDLASAFIAQGFSLTGGR